MSNHQFDLIILFNTSQPASFDLASSISHHNVKNVVKFIIQTRNYRLAFQGVAVFVAMRVCDKLSRKQKLMTILFSYPLTTIPFTTLPVTPTSNMA